MYLYSGFYVIFLTVVFLDFALKSRYSALWAGMGRIVRSLTVAATVLPALIIYDVAGSTVLAVGNCPALIGILLVLLPKIGYVTAAKELGGEAAGLLGMPPLERLKLYARHCSLPPAKRKCWKGF